MTRTGNVVVCHNHTEVKRIFNQLEKRIRDMLVTGIVEIIVIGILEHPLVEKRPCQNILPYQ